MGAYEDAKHYVKEAHTCLSRTSEMYECVKAFMVARGQEPKSFMSTEDLILRARLVLEEAYELVDGLGLDCDGLCDLTPNGKFNIEKAIDGCIDLLYVTIGTLVALDVPDIPFFELVHEANMKKGTVKDENGKVVKGENFQPPAIMRTLDLLRDLECHAK